MATCKDCLNADVCYMVEHYGVDIEEDRQEYDCHQFKAKTNYVEVVRCKDCTNFERKFPGYGYCYHWDYEQGMSPNEVEDNDFCSYGERRTNERKAD